MAHASVGGKRPKEENEVQTCSNKRVKYIDDRMRTLVQETLTCAICFDVTATPIAACRKNSSHLWCINCLLQYSSRLLHPRVVHKQKSNNARSVTFKANQDKESGMYRVDLCPARCTWCEFDEDDILVDNKERDSQASQIFAKILSGNLWMGLSPFKDSHYATIAYQMQLAGYHNELAMSYVCPSCKQEWVPRTINQFLSHVFRCRARRFSCHDPQLANDIPSERCCQFQWQRDDEGGTKDEISASGKEQFDYDLLDAYMCGFRDARHTKVCRVLTYCTNCISRGPLSAMFPHVEDHRQSNIFMRKAKVTLQSLVQLVKLAKTRATSDKRNKILEGLQKLRKQTEQEVYVSPACRYL